MKKVFIHPANENNTPLTFDSQAPKYKRGCIEIEEKGKFSFHTILD